MRIQTVTAFLLAFSTLACGGARSITRGAEGSAAWTRRLAAAVPIGVFADSARVLLERNGFRCQVDSAGAASLWCDKESGGRFAIVRRRWQAVLGFQDHHITAVKGTTGRIGP